MRKFRSRRCPSVNPSRIVKIVDALWALSRVPGSGSFQTSVAGISPRCTRVAKVVEMSNEVEWYRVLEGAFSGIARFSETVHAGSNHAELATLAMKTATIERDVAHLIFPDEVQHQVVDDDTPAATLGERTIAV